MQSGQIKFWCRRPTHPASLSGRTATRKKRGSRCSVPIDDRDRARLQMIAKHVVWALKRTAHNQRKSLHRQRTREAVGRCREDIRTNFFGLLCTSVTAVTRGSSLARARRRGRRREGTAYLREQPKKRHAHQRGAREAGRASPKRGSKASRELREREGSISLPLQDEQAG